ncbi:MAG: AAA family ATPase [Chthoniobacterales bacterium]
MIALTFQKPHRSIKELPPIELNDFALITGVNGAGKSHLLEAIEKGLVQVAGINAVEGIKRYDWTNLTVKLDEVGDPLETRKRKEQAIAAGQKAIEELRQALVRWFTTHAVKTGQDLADCDWLLLADDAAITDIIIRDKSATFSQSHIAKVVEGFVKLRDQIPSDLSKKLKQFGEFASELIQRAKEKECSLLKLDATDLRGCVPLSWAQAPLLDFRFAELFTAYHATFERNRINRYYAEHEGNTDLPWLDEEAFVRRYGPKPWDLANRVLEKASLRYKFNQPTASLEEGSKFTLRLTDRSDPQIELKVADLSSGERILLSITLLLYQVTTNQQLAALPQMLVLDEVDAPLHPSFTKLLLEVLKDTLVDQYGLKILLTTHSPSTVALAPENSLYELDRHPRHLKPVTRAHAVQVLTSGFVTVMPTSRVVVVESSFDSLCHAELCESITGAGFLASTPPLSFLQASKEGDDGSNGGVAQVNNWAPKLDSLFQEIGFRGLIDRDESRSSVGVVKVLNRYSIENYLLDPLTIAALFIKDGVVSGFNNCSITDMNFHRITSLNQESLQHLANDVVAWLEKDHAILVAQHPGRFDVKYLFGPTLSLPVWVRDFRGHDLKTICKQTLNPMCDKMKRPIILPARDSLARVLEMQTKCLPSIIPEDLRDIYTALKS